jgi:capsular polysaccharide biosynthesis protein
MVPDKDKKVKPKRSMICILAVFTAFFIAIFLAFVIEFVRKIKRDEPERFAQISNELRLFRIGSKKREKVGVGV